MVAAPLMLCTLKLTFEQDAVPYLHTARYSTLALGLATHYET
jgi:hypothetical protein